MLSFVVMNFFPIFFYAKNVSIIITPLYILVAVVIDFSESK